MGGAFFSNGAHPSGFLRHPGKLSKDGKQAIRESLAARHEGAENAHKTLILEDGLEYQSVGLSNEDAQFIQTRGFQIAEVARMFSIPPPRLGDYSKANYSNIEQSAQDFVQALRPWTVKFEQEVSLKLAEQPAIYVEHLFDALLRADTKDRFEAYRSGRDGGWLSANDIRRMENLDPIAGGDSYLVPLNHSTVGGPSQPTRDDQTPLFQSQGQSAALLTSAREILITEIGRYVRRECSQARRAQATGPKLRAFVDEYYADRMNRDRFIEMIKPGVKLWHTLAGLDVDVDHACAALVDRHFADSRRELLSVCDAWGDEGFGEALQRKLLHWEEHRAQTVIDHLIEHGIPPEPSGGLSISKASAMLKETPEPRVRTVSMASAVLKQAVSK